MARGGGRPGPGRLEVGVFSADLGTSDASAPVRCFGTQSPSGCRSPTRHCNGRTVGAGHSAADRGAAEPRSIVGASDRIST